ncbi:MAG: hypothetical protein SOY65_02210 [Marinifilaceae bacterium]|nr:hypothetical protein [Marinifilaceae bacterium]
MSRHEGIAGMTRVEKAAPGFFGDRILHQRGSCLYSRETKESGYDKENGKYMLVVASFTTA